MVRLRRIGRPDRWPAARPGVWGRGLAVAVSRHQFGFMLSCVCLLGFLRWAPFLAKGFSSFAQIRVLDDRCSTSSDIDPIPNILFSLLPSERVYWTSLYAEFGDKTVTTADPVPALRSLSRVRSYILSWGLESTVWLSSSRKALAAGI